MTTSLTRRTFLKTATAAGGGLMIGAYLPLGNAATALAAGTFEPNVWIKINADDTVRIMLTMLEMGQGVMTSMPMLVAEELDFDWTKIKTEWAPADARYGNPNFGGQQLTAGSNSVRGMWKVLRESGAAARSMLVTAAAQTWSVPESALTTDKGEVIHQASGRRAKYGALVDKAATLPVPSTVTLKDPKAFKLLGQSLPRLDVPEKVNGTAQFGIDVKLPGLLTARVVQMPGVRRQGGQLQRRQGQGGPRRDARRADQRRHRRRRRRTTGRRRRARRRSRSRGTKGRWRSCRAPRSRSSYAELAQQPGKVARNDGNAEAALDPRARSDRTAGAHVRARVRSAVPRPRVHGADELHGRRAGRQLRRLRADASRRPRRSRRRWPRRGCPRTR